MEKNFYDKLREEMEVDGQFKVIKVFEIYESDASQMMLKGTFYEAKNAIEYIELLKEKHREEYDRHNYKIRVRIDVAEKALRLSKMDKRVRVLPVDNSLYGWGEEHIVVIPTGETSEFKKYRIFSYFEDKSFGYDFEVEKNEYEKAVGKKFSELSEEAQEDFIEECTPDQKEDGPCYLDYGNVKVFGVLTNNGCDCEIADDAIIEKVDK